MATQPLNVSELLKYANLQIAAEALYNFNAVTNGSTLIPGAIDATGRNVASANLVTGNLHVTKMTPTEVAWNQLPDLWTVVEHESNTTTGFSGTLFKATRDDPASGTRKDDLVLSFRSTEFIDDAARDQEATNKLEVSELGWAFGQIDDMRTWYQSLRTKYAGDFAAAAGRLSVTGYSLGGQMATAFNLMYPGAARQVVLFNGAGMGSVGDGSLVTTELKMPEMMSYFHQLRAQSDDPNGLATLMKSAWGRDMYAQLRGLLNVSGLVEANLQALLANALVYLNDRWNAALTDRSLTDYAVALNDRALLQRGLERAYKVAEYAHDAPSLESGATGTGALGHPAAIPDIVDGKLAIAGESLDYQLAVIASADKYSAKAVPILFGVPNGLSNALGNFAQAQGSPLANQFDVSGTEMDSEPGYFMVAHSQYRYGSEIKLPIEDQPLYRGNALAAFLFTSQAAGELRFLLPQYTQNDFGDTHSIILMVDSLSVQSVLSRLDPTLPAYSIKTFLQASSNSKQESTAGTQGVAEGDTLEKLLDAMRTTLQGPGLAPTPFGLDGNTWGDPNNREAFYANLSSLTNSDAYRTLTETQSGDSPADKVRLGLATKQIGSAAREDFAAMAALLSLSPVVLRGTSAANQLELINALGQSWGSVFVDWQNDNIMTAAQRDAGAATFTDQWIADRAAMLDALIRYNIANASGNAIQVGSTTLNSYVDVATSRTLREINSGLPARFIKFGGTGNDSLDGASEDDHLYGGDGNDTLSGKTGYDYLQGDAGDDSLAGDTGKDTLLGGSGSDTLDGGSGNDTLLGGAGNDTYLFSGAWGQDVITDSDGSGRININGWGLLGGTAIGTPGGGWQEQLFNDQVVDYRIISSDKSTTGKQLVVKVQGDTSDNITINNFDVDAATSGTYLGLHLNNDPSVAIMQGSGPSFWRDLHASTASLAGKFTDLAQGAGAVYTVYLNAPAAAGSFVLHLGGALVDKGVKAVLGDTTVDADGATISLTEGQTQVSFALVQDGNLDGDISGSISVTYQGQDGRSATSNSWGLNLTDAGDPTNTLTGDFLANTQVNDGGAIVRTGVNGSVTVVANGDPYFVAGGDGNLLDGGDTLVADNVLLGTAGVDSISGGIDNDLLAGNAGNDQIDGGSGDDMIAGGAGNDQISGGDGDDWISSASNIDPDAQQLGPNDQWSQWGLPVGKTALAQGSTWGVYVNDQGTTIWSGIDQPATDAQSDAIDAGAGDDHVLASWGDDRVQGGDGNDEIEGLAGGDVLEGDAGDDTISGDGILTEGFLNTVAAENHGSDFIDGGAGNDSLTGGGAADDLFGGDGNDTIYGDVGVAGDDPEFLPLAAQGADYIDGEDGDDYAEGDGGSDTLYGGAGADKLWGDQSASRLTGVQLGDAAAWGDDYLDGEDGNDTLIGGGGADTLYGGDGDDLAFGDESNPALPSAFNGNDYIDGEGGNDTLIAGGGDDYVYGGDGNDQLSGDDSASQLPGQFHGSDYLDGEAGDDTLWGGGGGDEIYGGSGNDHLNGDDSSLSGDFHGDDYLDGGDGNDKLYGQGGSDTLVGGAGNDSLIGDDAPEDLAANFHGDDVLDGGDGDDTMIGGGGSDEMSGGSGNDILIGDDQSAALDAQYHGADSLDGGDGDDTLVGLGGADTLVGGAGNDVLTGDDYAELFAAADSLDGGDGNDSLYGGGGDDTLVGGAGNDLLSGQDGDDQIAGGDGNDTLFSGTGTDTLDGGTGDDVYIVTGSGTKRIVDDGGVDRLVLDWKSSDTKLDLGSLMLVNQATGQQVHIENFDPNDPLGSLAIEEFVLQDDTGNSILLTAGQLLARGRDVMGTPDADQILGTGLDENIDALAGDDLVLAGEGNDSVIGGDGNDTLYGEGGQDSITGGAGGDALFGGEGNDSIDAGGGADYVDAGFGDDRIAAGSGNDTLYGGDGTDTIDAGTGDNYVDGGAGDDSIVAADGSDTLFGGDGNDSVDAATGNNYVDAGSGDDSVAAADGSDVLFGGDGNDSIDAGSGDNHVDAGSGNDRIIAGDGNDTLFGGDGNDSIDAGAGDDYIDTGDGNDHIDAGAGRDFVDGGAGADTMAGGDGDDIYVVDDAGDVVTELGTAGAGDDTVQSSISYALGSNLENLVLTGGADIDGTGNADDNTLTGNDGNNALDGGAGADVMRGGLGDDIYRVERSSDTVIERVDEGYDAVVANTSYVLPDNVEVLALAGVADYDATGNALDNLIIGNAGNNVIDGGAGADTMAGGGGRDTYFVDDTADQVIEMADGGHDTVNASATFTLGTNVEDLNLVGTNAIDGAGNDFANSITGNAAANRIDAAAGDDTVYGGDGDDILIGGDGNDSLFGEAGNDFLDGGTGNDDLDGGPGVDTMAGGAGSDRYIVDDSADTIVEDPSDSSSDFVEATATFTLPDNVEFLYLEGSADIDGTGNDGANWIFGNSGINRLAGGGGDDFYQVQNTADTIVEGADAGYDRVLSSVDYTLSDNVEELSLEYGSVGDRNTAVQAIGNASDNVITGNQQANIIEGRAGNDWLDGADGNDSMSGGDGNDMLFGGWDTDWNDEFVDNRDVLSGGAGDDTLDGYSGNDTLLGGDGNDVLYGGDVGGNEENSVLTNDDVAYGGAGNDTIDGGSGADLLFGEDGDDSIYGGDGTTYLFGNFGRIFDPASGEYRYGTFSENDTLDGGAGNDTLDGGVGDDMLVGGTGTDALFGSSGNDTLDGGAGKDSLDGGTGNDVYKVDGSFDVVQAPSTLTWCGEPEEHWRLQWDTDTVLENYGSGYDVVEAYGGFVLPDNVEELRLVTDPNADPAYAAALATYGQDGTGNDLDNLLVGNELANRLDGGAGFDRMIGGAGDDTYVVDSWGDTIVEQPGQGIDTVVAQTDGITLGADVENLVLAGDAWYGWGNELDNQLTGGGNDDELFAGDGNDTLIGGAGSDWLFGEGGDDTYVFRPGEGDDEIFDYAGSDVLFIGGHIGAADLHGERDGDSLWIHVRGDNAGSVYIDNWFANDAGQGVNRIEFCDAPALDHDGMAALVNRPPVAQPDALVAHEDGGAVAITEAELLANDTDPDTGDSLAVIAVGPSALGVDVAWSGGAVRYDIGNGYQSLGEGQTLQDSFSYTIADSYGATAESLVAVTIVGTNDAPGAVADAAAAAEDSILSATGNVLANDSDVDNGDVLGVASTGVQVGAYGSLDLALDGSFTYALANSSTAVQSLAAGQVVTDNFSYTAHDASGAASTASLVVTITGANDAPTAFADAAEVSEDGTLTAAANVLANDSDPDIGDMLSVTTTGAQTGSYGDLVLGADGNYSYVLANATDAVQTLAAGQMVCDNFTYTARDPSGATSTASLVVVVNGANDAPILVTPAPDASTAEGQLLSIDLPDTMFTDIDQGDVLAYSAQLAGGGDLPSWLAFDANRLKLTGAPPRGSAGQFFDVQLTAIDRSGATASDVFRISVTVPPGLALTGTSGDDTLRGGWGNDTLDGGAGSDTMIGDYRDDTYFVDSYVNTGTGKGNEGLGNGQDPPPPGHDFNWNDGVGTSPGNPNSAHGNGGGSSPPPATGDVVIEAPGEGWDTVYASVSYVLPENVEAVRLQGSADLDAFGNSGSNWLVGNPGANVLAGNEGNDLLSAGTGNDTLYGGMGNDVLEGQDGADRLYGGDGADALLGGGGADQIFPGAGRAFVAGGTGNDSITMGTDATVVAFNRGDGADVITTQGNVPLVLSLGGGIRVEDVALRRSGNDLIVDAGNGDTIELSKWYANNSAHPQLELQVVSAAPAGDSLHDNRVEWFDGQGLAAAFDDARKQGSSVTRWDMMNAALANHLGGSDIAALGGDIAYLYGVNGTLAGVGLDPAGGVLADPAFGTQAQALQSSQQLQAGPARIAA